MIETRQVKLLIQPEDGVLPLIKGIAAAKKSIEIVIFRFDQREIERALANAVSRGVSVQALIAHTNRAGEENLRNLELRLLAAGVTVSRSADDLVRYHGKYMIVDRHVLFLLAFNLTMLDIERSRSFGVVTRNKNLVAEAVRLFEADSQRRPYEPGNGNLVVSPTNARSRLAALVKDARKDLTIYDLKVSDRSMMRLLEERAKAGVSIRIIGRMTRKVEGITVRRLQQMRLHTRSMVVDGKTVFVGSQSLRENELDARREVGVTFKDAQIASQLLEVFEKDWSANQSVPGQEDDSPFVKVAKKVAKTVTRELPPVLPLLNGAVKEVVGDKGSLEIKSDQVEELVKSAVKEAVREALTSVVEGVVDRKDEDAPR
jgi:phosphatidylserine/phosphatidylglycerophosphate/cardiolipin synthase-like enzyme